MARNFNGGTDAIRWAYAASTIDTGTIAFWMRTTQTTSIVHVLSHANPANSRSGWTIILNNTANKITAQGWDASVNRLNIASTTSVNDGNPHHIAFSFNRFTGQPNEIYIDGVQEVSANSSLVWSGGVNGFDIQSGAFSGGFWSPLVADLWEIGYWSGVKLNADEIAALAKGFAPKMIRPTSLRMYAPLVREPADRRNGFSVSVTGTTVVPHGRVIGGSI